MRAAAAIVIGLLLASPAGARRNGRHRLGHSEGAARFEGLLRFDHLQPDKTTDADRDRLIAGIAYWFPKQGNVTAALLVQNDGFVPAQADERRYTVHMLINF